MLRPQDDLLVVLAPPVGACINCGRQLVSNHCTKVKYYSEGGVLHADKATLHSVDRKLFYNLTQYGNKSDPGKLSCAVLTVSCSTTSLSTATSQI